MAELSHEATVNGNPQVNVNLDFWSFSSFIWVNIEIDGLVNGFVRLTIY